ncbi:MAG: CvpA family protein [Clostridiales bacterium]|nr:CvpA family protein [Clostridiales bacterium]
MAILIDILLAALLLSFFFAGLRTGLVRSLIGFLGSIAALIAAICLGNLIANWMYTGLFRSSLVDTIRSAISGQGAATVEQQAQSVLSALPSFLSNALQNMGVTSQQLGASITDSSDAAAQSAADFVSPVIVHLTALGLTILLFIGFRIGIYFLARLIDGVFRLPVLNTINRILGGAFGLLKGGVVAFLLATVVLVAAPLLSMETAGSVHKTIEASYLCRWFYDNNPVSAWFMSDF